MGWDGMGWDGIKQGRVRCEGGTHLISKSAVTNSIEIFEGSRGKEGVGVVLGGVWGRGGGAQLEHQSWICQERGFCLLCGLCRAD